MADTTIGHVPWYMPSPSSISIPKSAALSALLTGTGAAYSGANEYLVSELAAAADPNSGAAQSVLNPGPEVKASLQALYAANESNPAASLLLQLINQM